MKKRIQKQVELKRIKNYNFNFKYLQTEKLPKFSW
jgi:hypothetical protein